MIELPQRERFDAVLPAIEDFSKIAEAPDDERK
jgi:hypothetical protein